MLLVVIYIAFISLGIPDAVLGSAWPVIYKDLNVQLSYAGILTMIIAGGTIVSSFYSDKIVSRYNTAKVTVFSTGMTAFAILGFAFANSFWQLCLFAIPYGLGAGSIDAALNNFVALHYKAKHMNWLHCCWGIGASLGPLIMGKFLLYGFSWNLGYLTISILQILLFLLLFCSLPIWIKNHFSKENKKIEFKQSIFSKKEIIKIAGVKEVLISFFCYCALESTAGLWASSYLVFCRGIKVEMAAILAAMFYFGITAGRFICGFISIKIEDKIIIRFGQYLILAGLFMIMLPFSNLISIIGLLVIGLGCAPIYPSLIHSTPKSFGINLSQSIIGMQMASAYIGTTFIPPLFGFLQKYLGTCFYPLFLIFFVLTMIILLEKMNKKILN